MKVSSLAWLGLAAAGLAGCAREAGIEPTPMATHARADVRDAGGRTLATAEATEAGGGLRLRIEAAGLAPGTYAAHVHGVGRCDAPGFESAGAHWNPLDREHGTSNPAGPHMGDLPNLMVGSNGEGSLEMTIAGARLGGGAAAMLDGDGAALVIHARPDDYRTDPSGNSGGRIGCGAFG